MTDQEQPKDITYTDKFSNILTLADGTMLRIGYCKRDDAEEYSGLISKCDANNNELDRKTINDELDSAYPTFLTAGTVLADGTVICAGFSNKDGKNTGFLIKLTSDLVVINSSKYNDSVEQIIAIICNADNELICTGPFVTPTDDGKKLSTIIMKIDADTMALKKHIFVGIDNIEVFSSFSICGDGAIIATGFVNTPGESQTDALVTKLDNELNIITSRKFSESNVTSAFATSVSHITEDGEIITCMGTMRKLDEQEAQVTGLSMKFTIDLEPVMTDEENTDSTVDESDEVVSKEDATEAA